MLGSRTRWLPVLYVALSAHGCGSPGNPAASDPSSTSEAETTAPGSTGAPTPTTADPSASSAGISSSTGGETPGTESGDGCDFLGCGPDVPSTPECNTWDDDCPSGEKCTFWANDGGNSRNATRCVPLAPDPAGPGEPCTSEGSGVSGLDDCDVGSMCWNVDAETLQGECIPFCEGQESAPTCDDPQRTCSIGGGPLALCVPLCHPLDPEPCSPGEGCYPYSNSTVCAPDASGPKTGDAFDECEFLNACSAGLICVAADEVGSCESGSARCCTPWCELGGTDCPDPTTCIPAYPEGSVPVGQETVGFCGQAG
ncbi:MAG: hypothetical protein ACRBN8_23950 [Nannocystales bacterium]